MDKIKAYLETYAKLNDIEWGFFSSKLHKRTIGKKTIILQLGQIEKQLSFIEEGVVRLYIPKIENDLNFGFVFQDDFVSGYDSFITQTPSLYQIESLTNTVLWQINYEDLQQLYAHTSIANKIKKMVLYTCTIFV